MIDGEEYFITDVRHSITRSSAETRLTIGGKRNKATEIEDTTPKMNVDIHQIETDFIAEVDRKIQEHVAHANKESELRDKNIINSVGNISHLSYNGGDINEKDMEKLFPSQAVLQAIVDPIKTVHQTIKV